MAGFPDPKEGSVFYEDGKIYACLAFHPIAEGHSIVAWKEDVEDINDLSFCDYLHLMDVIYQVRRAMLKVFNTDKVYMAYLDEARHVHFHLVPREKGGKMGFELLSQPHGELVDFAETVASLREALLRGCPEDTESKEAL